jgi:hypothetical protein
LLIREDGLSTDLEHEANTIAIAAINARFFIRSYFL